MSLTTGADAVRPADNVGVSFVELSSALHRNFTVVKLLDVPSVHSDCFQLHLISFLQRDDPVAPLDINPRQHAVDRAVPSQGLTRNQSLGITCAEGV